MRCCERAAIKLREMRSREEAPAAETDEAAAAVTEEAAAAVTEATAAAVVATGAPVRPPPPPLSTET